MQRIGIDGIKKISFYILSVVILSATIVIDLLTKSYFKNLYFEQGNTVLIKGVISATYTKNTGAAWSFLSGVSWAQTFFKVLTIVALCLFIGLYLYSIKNKYLWLSYAIIFIIGGTVGNFIDRVAFGYVRDFILLTFMDFPVFNLADSFLCVGVCMFIIHYLFLDADALFKKPTAINEKSTKLNDENNQIDNGASNESSKEL